MHSETTLSSTVCRNLVAFLIKCAVFASNCHVQINHRYENEHIFQQSFMQVCTYIEYSTCIEIVLVLLINGDHNPEKNIIYFIIFIITFFPLYFLLREK
jgi:hypothetical protein